MDKKEVLLSKYQTIKLNEKLKNLKDNAGFVIQSLLFPKKEFSLSAAIKWASSKGFSVKNESNTDNFIHFRQKVPSRFGSFRTILLGDGVKARVAGNNISNFVGSILIPSFSKFSAEEIKSDLDIKIPMEVGMRILSDGPNKDGVLRRPDQEESLDRWKNIPIIDFHNMAEKKKATTHKMSDRKGFLSNNPELRFEEGKQWIYSKAFITDRYLAYLIYLSERKGKPLQISAEFKWNPKWVGDERRMTNLIPKLISIVDDGHIVGNQINILSS